MNRHDAHLLFKDELGGEQNDKGYEARIPANRILLNPSTLRYIARQQKVFVTSTILTNTREGKKFYKEVPIMTLPTVQSVRNFLNSIK